MRQGVEEALAEETRPFIDRVERVKRRPWQQWIDASWGLREYWYPAMYSRELPDGESKPVTMLGEEILVVRNHGTLFAVEDRCAHRGTRFSERPLLLSEDTVTCWYHTWTYDLADGRIRCILNDPDSVLAGKPGIRTYSTTETKGIVWVFVGDGDPPPLKADVPPGFLDEDMALHQPDPQILKANWRLCLENSFDPGHHFIHNWSPYVMEAGFPMTFGYVAKRGEEHAQVEYHLDGPGPKGFTRGTKTTELIFEATIPGKGGAPGTTYTAPAAVGRSREELIDSFMAMPPIVIGIWMPVGTSAENFPSWHTGFDFCVPVDDRTTRFFPMGGRRCHSEEERRAWEGQQGHDEWKVPIVDKFLADDNMARESMQKFYEHEDGWYQERLYRPDLEITMFRKFFSEHARGIQPAGGAGHR